MCVGGDELPYCLVSNKRSFVIFFLLYANSYTIFNRIKLHANNLLIYFFLWKRENCKVKIKLHKVCIFLKLRHSFRAFFLFRFFLTTCLKSQKHLFVFNLILNVYKHDYKNKNDEQIMTNCSCTIFLLEARKNID